MNAPANALWHVVLISFGKSVTDEKRKRIYDMYQTLDRDCGGMEAGIFFWKVEHNLDTRKDVHLVEVAVFRDNDALRAFRAHPKHRELTDTLSVDRDTKWWVGDFENPFDLG